MKNYFQLFWIWLMSLIKKAQDNMQLTIEHRPFQDLESDGDAYLQRLRKAQQELRRGDSLHSIARRYGLTKREVKGLKPKATGRFFIWDRKLDIGERPCVSAEFFDPITQSTNAARLGATRNTAYFDSAPAAFHWLHTKKFEKSGAQKWPVKEATVQHAD